MIVELHGGRCSSECERLVNWSACRVLKITITGTPSLCVFRQGAKLQGVSLRYVCVCALITTVDVDIKREMSVEVPHWVPWRKCAQPY